MLVHFPPSQLIVLVIPSHFVILGDNITRLEDIEIRQFITDPPPFPEEVHVILEKQFSSRDFKFARGTFFTTLVRLERRKNRNKGPPIV